MKWLCLLPILLSGCIEDGKTKVGHCDSLIQYKETNSTGTAEVYSNGDKIGLRLALFRGLTLKRLMLKGIFGANTSFLVQIYRGSYYGEPDAGTLVAETYAYTSTTTTSLEEVWFNLFSPLEIGNFITSLEDSNFIVITFISNVSLDLGASSGSNLRNDYRKGSTVSGWYIVESSKSISLGLEGSDSCQ